jgi:hypothetical protein
MTNNKMQALNCSQFLADHLESWLEGVRPPEGEAHLRDCPSCQSVTGDVAAITSLARSIASQDPEPPARVWLALRARMEEQGLIARDTADLVAQPGQPIRWMARWFGWIPAAMPRPAVAVVYLALMAVGGFMIGSHSFLQSNDARWYDRTQEGATPVSAVLDTAEQNTISGLHESNPIVAASFHKNLVLVDNYIQLCEKSVREEPQNELARDYLYDAYQQKADLLDQISDRGEESR